MRSGSVLCLGLLLFDAPSHLPLDIRAEIDVRRRAKSLFGSHANR